MDNSVSHESAPNTAHTDTMRDPNSSKDVHASQNSQDDTSVKLKSVHTAKILSTKGDDIGSQLKTSDDSHADANVEKTKLTINASNGHNTINGIIGDKYKYVCMLIILRGLQAWSLSTAFAPDEWYQALEIAHVIVYGRGYLTWEWISHIRGFAHPYMYVPVFYTLKLLRIDTPSMLVVIPRVLQGMLEGVCELALYRLAYRTFGREAARMTLFCSLLSWSMWYLSGRTLSNSVEMIFTTVALDLWHWPGIDVKPDDRRSFKGALFWAACSCVVRPTSALLWAALGLYQLWYTDHRLALLGDVLCIGVPIFTLSVGLDSYMYGQLVIVPWEFVKENVLNGVAGFYGTNQSHWYLSSAMPTLLAAYLPLFVLGAWSAWTTHRRGPLLCIAWVVLVHSLLEHKEFRFIVPMLPLMHMHCGVGLQTIREYLLPPAITATVTYSATETSARDATATGGTSNAKEVALRRLVQSEHTRVHTYEKPAQATPDSKRLSRGAKARNVRLYQCLYWALVVTMATSQLLAGLYFTQVHQRGTVDVLTTLRTEFEAWGAKQSGTYAQSSGEPQTLYATCESARTSHYGGDEQLVDTGEGVCAGALDSADVVRDVEESAGATRDRRHEKSAYACDRAHVRIHVWAPCHSTPYFSHMHYDAAMRFLTCPPYTAFVDMTAAANLKTDTGSRDGFISEKTKSITAENYVDEADRFYADPVAFIEEHYGPRHGKLDLYNLEIKCNDQGRNMTIDRAHSTDFAHVCLAEPDMWGGWPTHIVMFDALLPQVAKVLEAQDYELAHSLFHTHIPDGRVGEQVLIFRKTSLRHCLDT
ncbi:hypothetical protein SARC_00142 [Sphaeroforma arctica JP610]|uniref:Mannosyltransferase n=1 Tax=Sphaeroforma arctica JP610 TaxID=667725 RepID=A0A0L0GFC9_9EUKA|nr:hypothetical protein SARC_00142 [Sphaeroforma arctica JP610]KNC87770.1 hypothetical protein SARC_00142 [Sphaeroforma arctica JP610]|eukprot:XP_014161672.1 hypothetical protein SARC_00142 [Sphaeroforma arctica JP610]